MIALLATLALAPNADAEWNARAYLDTDQERLEHARTYLRRYPNAPLQRQLIAHVIAGEILWRRSCPEPQGCVGTKQRGQGARKPRRDRTGAEIPAFCSPRNLEVPRVVARTPSVAFRAQQHVGQALSLSRSIEHPDPQTSDALATARLLQLEPEYEELVAVTFPLELDFAVEVWKKGSGVPKWERQYAQQLARKERSIQRLKEWAKTRMHGVERLAARYEALGRTAPATVAVAALHKRAQAYHATATAWLSADVPKSFRTAAQAHTFCDVLQDHSEDVEKAAMAAFAKCLGVAVKRGAFEEPARSCEKWLGYYDAVRFPSTSELFGESRYGHTKMARYGVQLAADPAVSPTVVLVDADPSP